MGWALRQRTKPRGLLMGLVAKRQMAIYGVLTIVVGLSEAFGVAMVFPILRFVEVGEEAFQEAELPAVWDWIISGAKTVGVPINLPSLLMMAFIPVIVRQVFAMCRVVYGSHVVEGARARLRHQGFNDMVKADIRFLADNRQGELIGALTLETHRAGETVRAFMELFATLFLFAVYGGLLLAMSPTLTLVALSTAVFASLIINMFISPRTRRLGRLVSENNTAMHNFLGESLSGVRLVKLFSQEDRELSRLDRVYGALRTSLIGLTALRGSVAAIMEPIFVIGLFSIIYVGVEVFGMGLATLGTLVLVLLRMLPLARTFNGQRQAIIGSWASLQHVDQTIRQAHAARDIISGPVPFTGLKSSIELDHVSFSYGNQEGDDWALDDVSFVIPRGSMTAIVGHSGAGKSTLVDLVPRLRDPSRGEVRFDGLNLKELELTSLRRAIGFVSQEPILFNDTIFNNIAYGSSHATPALVQEAARRAYAHDFIVNTPEGYDTVVGDRGIRLSAGQRQRLGIARVMLQAPDIIILDEPTSALDSESEYYIRRGLEEVRQGKTLVVIAHRLSTIQQADQIIVLHQGKVVEQGDHKVLLAQNGNYSRLFELQVHV